MYLVVNRFRPLTPDAASTVSVMHEIENAGAPPFTGSINNSNLGAETGAEDILSSIGYAEELSRISGLPVAAVTVKEDLYEELKGKIDNLYPLRLQEKIYDYFKRR